MCAACAHPSLKCSQLPFETMPVIKAYPDGTKAVRCTEFAQGPQKAVAAQDCKGLLCGIPEFGGGHHPLCKHIPPTVQWLAPDDTEGGAT